MWRLPSLLLAGMTALVVIHLWSSAHVSDPTIVFDENGYLGNARWLAGGQTWEMPFAPGYSSAYSLVLTPVMAIVDDPSAQWVGVRVVNAILLASVFPLLFLVLHQVFDLPRNRALGAALVGSLVPATFSAGLAGIAENLVLPLVPATVLTVWWMLDADRGWPTRVLAGPAAALLYATHPRFTLAVPLCALLLAWTAFRRLVRPQLVLANGAGLVVVVTGSRWLDTAVQSARWHGVERLEGDLGDWLGLLTSRDGLAELALTATGQLWYLAVGSLGLSVVGLAWFARRAWTSRRAPDRGTARSVVLTATLVLAASVFVTSVFFFAQNQFRPDHFVYGRHNDSFSPLWVGAAVALVVARGLHRRVVALMAAATTFILASGVLLAATRDPEVLNDVFSSFAVPAIKRFVELTDQASAIIDTTLLAALGSVVVLAWVAALDRIPSERTSSTTRAGFPIVLAAWFAFMGLGAVTATSAFHGVIYDSWDPLPTLGRLGVDELCIEDRVGRGGANLFYAWALPEVTVRSSAGMTSGTPPCTFTVAGVDDPVRRASGDRLALLDEGGVYRGSGMPEGAGVWVAPGPTADRLERIGALLPEDFPGELPEQAQAATISVEGAPTEPVRVRAGSHFDVDLVISHAGEGAPWADANSYDLDGRVEMLARWRPVDGPWLTISAGPLPQWMWPGDTVRTTAEVFAVDETLTALPPGRYEVQVGVGQIGHDWFTGSPEATFIVDVSI